MALIVILDDEPERIGEMLSCLAAKCSEDETVIFDNAPDMIGWFRANERQLSLICLDHDLGPNRQRDGEPFDPGTGRDVADYLAGTTPMCPVILHTTNYLAAPGMERVLGEQGWSVSRVYPYSDLEWIGEAWIREVRRVLLKTIPN